MESAFSKTTGEVLKHFSVTETKGLSEAQINASREKHGRNGTYRILFVRKQIANKFPAIAEDPPTPVWELILEQFKDQLVIILLGSAAISFVLALFEEDGGWAAFVDPAVVSVSSEKLLTYTDVCRFSLF
jgi:Ca2+ transporting ATPase